MATADSESFELPINERALQRREPERGQAQPEPEQVEAGSELEQAKATIAELRERLAAALELAGQAAEGVPPV